MAEYRGVAGVARKVKKKYRGVAGVAREITKEYRGVAGVARLYFRKSAYSVRFATSNIDEGVNNCSHRFEGGAAKLYLNTTLSSNINENRPSIGVAIYSDFDIGGKTIEFTYKRDPEWEQYIDSILWFKDEDNKTIEWSPSSIGLPDADDMHIYGRLNSTEYTTVLMNIPEKARSVHFTLNSGYRGTIEQTFWINHLAIDGEDII